MKLAFGAGEKRSAGFTHHDGHPYPGIDLVHRWSPTSPLPLADGSVKDVLLALDVLEHFSRRDADLLVQEWFRVMAPGAQLIVCTIDMVRVAQWVQDLPGEIPWIIEHMYCRENFPGNWHYWAYTRVTLQDLLQKWGFVVERFEDSKLHRGNVLAYARRGPDGWREFDEIARSQVR